MNQNLSEQQFPPLYHGSRHEIEVGDSITPGAQPSQYPESWGTSKYAWATKHPSEAYLHGDYVYTVEPHDAGDLQPDDREPHAFASPSGFRVTGRLNQDDLREHIARYRGRA